MPEALRKLNHSRGFGLRKDKAIGRLPRTAAEFVMCRRSVFTEFISERVAEHPGIAGRVKVYRRTLSLAERMGSSIGLSGPATARCEVSPEGLRQPDQ